MKRRKAYTAALCGTAIIIFAVFGVLNYYGTKKAVPVISYVEEHHCRQVPKKRQMQYRQKP